MMINKKKRTMGLYVEAGAYARLFDAVTHGLSLTMSKVLYANDADMLEKLIFRIKGICMKAEDNMWADYPNLSTSEGTCVFFGDLDKKQQNEMDERVRRVAKEVSEELFYVNPGARAIKKWGKPELSLRAICRP